VLSSVFIPCVFITGISGQFFRQFALTIAVSTIISAFNSLTLSPALCAILLKQRHEHVDPLSWLLNFCFGWFFRLFNKVFSLSVTGYLWAVGKLLRVSLLVLVVYGGLLYLTGWSFQQMPAGFIPDQDQGYLYVTVQLPDAASLQRTDEAMAHVDQIVRETKGVAHTIHMSGISFILGANGSHLGTMFVVLKPFEDRQASDLSANAIVAALQRRLDSVQDARVVVFAPPPVRGLAAAGGFRVMIEDRVGAGPAALQEQVDNLVRLGNQETDRGLTRLTSIFRANTPQLYVDIDRTKCKTLGVALSDVFQTLQVDMGGLYVNDFNQFGRTWQVNAQADVPFRMAREDLRRLYVRNDQGRMVPLATVAKVEDRGGPFVINRYNMWPAAAVNGAARPGMSSGQVIEAVQRLTAQLPPSIGYEWTELIYLQLIAGNTTMFVFAGAVTLVFLVLAGQYESWSLPLAVILVVPMCILCAVIGVAIAKMDINIFTQIGFVVLVGLASKNAILIVEFAKAKHESGLPRREAALEACKLRLRPIIMTSLAFILGVLPLVVSSGAGAEMRRTLGIAVFSGMLGVTLFGIFLTPVFYYVVQWFGDLRRQKPL
jgi:multidrug efflux pump